MSYVLGAVALLVLGIGVAAYRPGRGDHERRTDGIVGMIVGADLMVLSISLAVAASA